MTATTRRLTPEQRAQAEANVGLVGWVIRRRLGPWYQSLAPAGREAVRDAAVAAYLKAVRHHAPARGKLSTLAALIIVREVRRLAARTRLPTATHRASRPAPGVWGLAGREPDPARAADRRLTAALVRAAVARLPPRERAAAEGLMAGELLRETAARCGVSRETARAWLAKAVRLLRADLGGVAGVPTDSGKGGGA